MKLKKDKLIYSMDKDNEPVLTIKSGDELWVETCDCFTETVKTEEDLVSELDWTKINPATGPIYVSDSLPGDVLKVEILKIEIEDSGVMLAAPGLGIFGDEIKKEVTKVIPIKDKRAIFNKNLKVDINPMIGVIGTAPKDEPVPTGTPESHGGNMDCKKIKEGNTLYLPVNVEGALLALGDLHAAMADGEMNGTGIEISGKVKIKVTLLKDYKFGTPMIESDDKLMSLYSAKTMEEASKGAAKIMHEVIMHRLNLSFEEAAMLLSIVGDLRVCQVVDPNVTMRVEVYKKYLK